MEYWLLVIGLIVLSAFFGPHIVDFFKQYIDWVNFKEHSSNKKELEQEEAIGLDSSKQKNQIDKAFEKLDKTY